MGQIVRTIVGVVATITVITAGGSAVVRADTGWSTGQLLSAEQLGSEWGGLDGVHRIGYVTIGLGGELVPAEAVVRLPEGTPPEGGWPVVAWGHGTSGLGQHCGFAGSAHLVDSTAPTVQRLNDAGYAVVAPDYIGLSPGSPGPHPYLQTGTQATATIDAVRAAHDRFTDLSASWAVAGYSQGGQAALGTGRYAPAYAPELDFRGTAALAPVSNLETIFLRSRPGQPEMPGFPGRAVAMVLSGMAGAPLDVNVDDYLTPQGRQFVAGLREECNSTVDSMLSTAKIGDMLSRPLDDPAFAPVLRDYMEVPVGGYRDPILLVHGEYDAVVPLPLTLTLIGQFLRNGTQHEVQLLRADHGNVVERGGLDSALAFLDRVLPAAE